MGLKGPLRVEDRDPNDDPDFDSFDDGMTEEEREQRHKAWELHMKAVDELERAFRNTTPHPFDN